jgi:hypothetical protein
MNNRSLLIKNFSKALNIGLKTKLGKIPSSTELANQFNLRAYGTKTISRETSRKWKNGLTLPEPANLQVLIDWLNLNPEEIFSLNEAKPHNLHSSAFSALQSINNNDKLLRIEHSAQAALNHVMPRVAVLDETGTIILVNDAWRLYAAATYADNKHNYCEGVNYLDVCDRVSGIEKEQVAKKVAGIRAVMCGDLLEFTQKYACHSLTEKKWYLGRVRAFVNYEYKFTVISHESITESRYNEE